MKQFYLLFFLVIVFCNGTTAQQADTVIALKDTTTLITVLEFTALQQLLHQNKYLNSKATPISFAAKAKKTSTHNTLFYLLVSILFFFGIIRTVYARYFSTLFRVFFNSSLRQSQLTDQLLQAKLPSLFFNLIFLLAGGFYVYFILQNLGSGGHVINWIMLQCCVAAFMAIYLLKYLTLKFMGWVTGYREEANTYIFVIFLINKIIGILLLPVIIVLTFSPAPIAKIVMVISFLLIGIMLLLRFFRSYSLLQHKLKVGRFHFLLYIFLLEILPIMIMYKAMEVFIVKYL